MNNEHARDCQCQQCWTLQFEPAYSWVSAHGQIEALKAEIARLRSALDEIANASTSQPAALNMPEKDWDRRVAWGLIGIARRALDGEEDRQ